MLLQTGQISGEIVLKVSKEDTRSSMEEAVLHLVVIVGRRDNLLNIEILRIIPSVEPTTRIEVHEQRFKV